MPSRVKNEAKSSLHTEYTTGRKCTLSHGAVSDPYTGPLHLHGIPKYFQYGDN